MTELHGKVTNRRGAMPWIAIAAGVVVVIGLLVFKMATARQFLMSLKARSMTLRPR